MLFSAIQETVFENVCPSEFCVLLVFPRALRVQLISSSQASVYEVHKAGAEQVPCRELIIQLLMKNLLAAAVPDEEIELGSQLTG